MNEKQSRASLRFCPTCGEPAPAKANYCGACGAALRAGDARPGVPPSLVGVVVLAAFLSVGLCLWAFILRPGTESSRPPLAKAPSQPGSGESPQSGQTSLPQSHPPIAVPPDAKAFLAELEKKAEAAPQDLEAWMQAAQAQYRAGQIEPAYMDKAEASYRHALSIDAKNLDALRGLGNVSFDRQRYPKAIESYVAYLALAPGDSSVRTDLGTMYLYAGEEDAAVREYRRVLEKDPSFYQAHFNLGVVYMKQDDRAQAIESFEKAKSLAPEGEARDRIASMIEHARGAEPAAPGGGSFQERVERDLRAHPVAGSKIAAVEWTSATEARVLFDDFPMDAMPDFARTKFVDRLKSTLESAKRAGGSAGSAKLELVDRASGKVMATVAD